MLMKAVNLPNISKENSRLLQCTHAKQNLSLSRDKRLGSLDSLLHSQGSVWGQRLYVALKRKGCIVTLEGSVAEDWSHIRNRKPSA